MERTTLVTIAVTGTSVCLSVCLSVSRCAYFPRLSSFIISFVSLFLVSPNLYSTILSSFVGCTVGSIVTMPISGLLTRYDFDGGWPAAFYPFGKLTVTNNRARFNEAVLR